MIAASVLADARFLANQIVNSVSRQTKKEAAKKLVEMALKHGVTWQIKTTAMAGGFTAVEIAAIETVMAKSATKQAAKKVAERGMTMSVSAFIQRFGMNFSKGPKGPGPVMIAITLGTFLWTAQEVHAETIGMESNLQGYETYLQRYGKFIVKRAAQGDHGRAGHVAPPLSFEEWLDSHSNLP